MRAKAAREAFATEAALCAAFLAWAQRRHPAVRAYAEWAGWDILLVFPEGWQLGIQAKLRLNAEVIGQAAPDVYGFDYEKPGPDYRAVLVPSLNPLAGLASRLGLVVLWSHPWPVYGTENEYDFFPELIPPVRQSYDHARSGWLDWNPRQRHDLPPVATDAIAGSPCPVTLTPWKLAALDVLAELEVRGTITTKRMKALGVNPSRWLQGFWLIEGERRGDWTRGPRCPRFKEQHPKAYALALAKAQSVAAATAMATPGPRA